MFELTSEDFHNWRSQIATSKSDMIGLRYPPFCFTEQGVTMKQLLNPPHEPRKQIGYKRRSEE